MKKYDKVFPLPKKKKKKKNEYSMHLDENENFVDLLIVEKLVQV